MLTDSKIKAITDLAMELECLVMYDEPMAKHSTFKVGGPARVMIDVNSLQSAAKLIKAAGETGVRYLTLGNGSNLLFDDRGFDGVVLVMGSSVDGIEMKNETTITAQAGCSLLKLCRFALEHSLTGLEFAYGIPGTVGGAIFMNAGAYGGEIKNVIKQVRSVAADGTLRDTAGSDLDMYYRHSCFMETGDLILEGTFVLTPGNYDDIQDRMVDLMGRRRDKQPLNFPSAGSVFKRPGEQIYAGKLIQDSGLRGYSIGGAQVSEKHCGFIVNKGGATCEDILALIKYVQKTVQEKTGYLLECEVRYIPFEENET